MIAEGLLPLLPDGRTIYRLQRGLEAMQWIRAWCGCRQYIEWRDVE